VSGLVFAIILISLPRIEYQEKLVDIIVIGTTTTFYKTCKRLLQGQE
jgi:hypothetical protein